MRSAAFDDDAAAAAASDAVRAHLRRHPTLNAVKVRYRVRMPLVRRHVLGSGGQSRRVGFGGAGAEERCCRFAATAGQPAAAAAGFLLCAFHRVKHSGCRAWRF